MSQHILLTGKLIRDPIVRKTAKGNDYVTCMVTSPNEETTILSTVIGFDYEVVRVISALTKGDSVSLTGSFTVKMNDKDTPPTPMFNIRAEGVLTPYKLAAKRKASNADSSPAINAGSNEPFVRPYEKAVEGMQKAGEVARVADLNDDIPWSQP